MKRIQVNAYELALVFRRGRLMKVLEEGSHWVWPWDSIGCFDMTKPLPESVELSLLEKDPKLNASLHTVTILDNEIGFEFKDGIFTRVLTAGKYAYWKSPVNYECRIYDFNQVEIPEDIPRNILRRNEALMYIRVFTVESYEQGILCVDGKVVKALDPGVYYFWNTDPIANVKKMDTRIQTMEVNGQEVLTKDKAAIRLNIQVQYKLEDLSKALLEANDVYKQLYVTIQLVIRDYVGTLSLDELLARKEHIDTYVFDASKEQATTLGLKVLNAGIKDIILPGDVKEIMNKVLLAEKKAQANIIMRREETASTRSLLNTAKLMEQNEMLFKLKEMEYVEKIADKIGEISVNGDGKILSQLKNILN